ncbi:MAG: aminopeptidase P family protein [Deltaproteobacteria bacterium]|jgi:Xaa-Pro aminopeptidase|nr:aminopeptidase P family protein [Deltaproteobacteria bacterium]
MNFDVRRQKAQKLLSNLGLDALILCQGENLRYFCNFTGTDGVFILTADQTVFLTDSRYTTQAGQQVIADDIQEYKVKTDAVAKYLGGLSLSKFGFEASIAFAMFEDLRNSGQPSWHWHALRDELEKIRLIKDDQETDLIRRAARLNKKALEDVLPIIQPGAIERDIALALEFSLKKNGAEEKAFDFIVASGPRGALPHGIASNRALLHSELVTIDFGCCFHGYHSDETVTLAVGLIEDELRKIFDIVLEAHDRAIQTVSPGIPLIDIDRVARDFIESAGYGVYFGHGLGHGVGLDVHEAPTVSPRSKTVAEPGMVFTIEPGIYLPNIGGVRIEDMVIVTEEGCQVLTLIPKTFRNILVN